jgi:hypothetical protein
MDTSTDDYVENVFSRSATQPATPTGNGIPVGWSDLPPAGTDQLWMSSADMTAAGVLIGTWSVPVTFGYGIQYSIDGATAWHPTYADGDHYYQTQTAGGAWSTPIRFVGEDATHYWMVALGGLKVTSGGAFVPSTITPSALQQTGGDAVLPYSGRFLIEDSPDGATWTTRYTSSADESSHAFAPAAGSASVRVSLYLAGGTTALVDQQLVPISSDGTNGSSGSSVLGTASGTDTLTPAGMTETSISLAVTTPTLINVQCSGSLQNNGTTNSTFAVVLYMDGSPVGGGCGWNTSGNLNAGNSVSFSFFGTPGITAGAHTFALWVGGYPESVTLAANFTIQQ